MQLAKKYHPDLNKGDKKMAEKFTEVSGAYEVLSDEKQRAQYDQFGHSGVDQQGGMSQEEQQARAQAILREMMSTRRSATAVIFIVVCLYLDVQRTLAVLVGSAASAAVIRSATSRRTPTGRRAATTCDPIRTPADRVHQRIHNHSAASAGGVRVAKKNGRKVYSRSRAEAETLTAQSHRTHAPDPHCLKVNICKTQKKQCELCFCSENCFYQVWAPYLIILQAVTAKARGVQS